MVTPPGVDDDPKPKVTDWLPRLVHGFGVADDGIRRCYGDAAVSNLLWRCSGIPTVECLRRYWCIIPDGVEHRHNVRIILVWNNSTKGKYHGWFFLEVDYIMRRQIPVMSMFLPRH